MGDQYTAYPENLKLRIDRANKWIADRTAFKALSPEQQEAELERIEKEKGIDPNAPPATDPNAPPAMEGEPAPSGEDTVESLKERLEKAEQRNRTLQGMIDHEAGEKKFLKDQLVLVQQQIVSLKDQITQKEPEPPKRIVLRDAIKEEIASLEKDMAPELVEGVVKIGEKIFDLGQEEARKSIREVANQVDGKIGMSAQQAFDSALLNAYPNWEAMWPSPEFQQFLNQPDGPLSVVPRGDIINRAFQRFDSRTVIKAFDLFMGKTVQSQPKPAEGLDPNNPKVKNRIAAPPGSSTNQDRDQNKNKPTMSRTEASQALVTLGARYSKGEFRGREEEYKNEHARLSGILRAHASPT